MGDRSLYCEQSKTLARTEAHCLDRIEVVLGQIARRQNESRWARAGRGLLAVIRLADSHDRARHRLEKKRSGAENDLARVREQRRQLECTAAEMALSAIDASWRRTAMTMAKADAPPSIAEEATAAKLGAYKIYFDRWVKEQQ